MKYLLLFITYEELMYQYIDINFSETNKATSSQTATADTQDLPQTYWQKVLTSNPSHGDMLVYTKKVMPVKIIFLH